MFLSSVTSVCPAEKGKSTRDLLEKKEFTFFLWGMYVGWTLRNLKCGFQAKLTNYLETLKLRGQECMRATDSLFTGNFSLVLFTLGLNTVPVLTLLEVY